MVHRLLIFLVLKTEVCRVALSELSSDDGLNAELIIHTHARTYMASSIFRLHPLLPPHLSRETSSSLNLSSHTNFSFPSCFVYRVPVLRTTTATAADGAKVGSQQDVYGQELLRKPVVSESAVVVDDDGGGEEVSGMDGVGSGGGSEEKWVDWEDQILEETAPLVGFVRMILHSNKYKSGERLSPENEKTILERLLPYHPEYEKKIGCGIDYLTVDYHPEFETSRCLFIVRKDGELVDFSYWKCIKGLIKKNYPQYADTFILRHFRWHRRKE